MWKLSYRLIRFAGDSQYRLLRRLSPAGLYLGGAAIVSAALGVDTNQTLAYQIFTLLAALGLIAMAASLAVRIPVTAQRSLPRTLAAGENFSYSIRLKNTGDRPLSDVTVMDTLSDHRPGFDEFRAQLRVPTYRGYTRLSRARQVGEVEHAHPGSLTARNDVEVRIAGRTYRRGVLRFENITLARPDPLGLFRTHKRIAQADNVIVLPRRYPVPNVTLPGARKYQPGGISNAASIGESEEFVGLREYRPGDALQRIHWKSFARLGKPAVREYQDEFFERHALALDTFGDASNPAVATAFEEAVSVAASFAYTVDTRDSLLDLLFVGAQSYCYTAGRGQMQPLGLLEVLAGAQLTRGRPISLLRDALVGRRAMLSGCILVLLAWDEARRTLLKDIHALGLPTLALLIASEPAPDLPASVRVLKPGRIAEGLARL